MSTAGLRIVADENIPGLSELLADQAQINFLPGREIQREDLLHSDVLLVRSVTQVNASLLEGTPVAFVGSCTIGTDHVDLDYLHGQGVEFANAPGCNADAVVDYVLAAMFHVEPQWQHWQGKTAGIVGLGQVGSRLSKRLQALGLRVLAYDPFVAAANDTYQAVLAADVVSFHVPITHQGPHATAAMLSSTQLQCLHKSALLINSCRGGVFDNQALFDFLTHESAVNVVLDVYEDEPQPDVELLSLLTLATPHIAGYSEQGKLRGTLQVLEKMFQHYSMVNMPEDLLAPTQQQLLLSHDVSCAELILSAYDIKHDSDAFQEGYREKMASERARYFDEYRKNYAVRTEWGFYRLNADLKNAGKFKKLGFSVA